MKDNPFDKIKIDTSPIADAKRKAIEASANAFDDTIARTQNQSAQAGAIQGVGNTARMSADTYAGVAGDRDRRNLEITSRFDAMEAQSAIDQKSRKDFASAEWESNQAGLFETVFDFVIPTISGGFGLSGALGFGKEIYNAFNKPSKTNRAGKGQYYGQG